MASGSVGKFKYSDDSSPITVEFEDDYSAGARKNITATDVGYPAVPTGYYAAFAGFYSDASALVPIMFDPNAAGSDNLVAIRNIGSALSDRSCGLHAVYIPLDMIQDDRNL